MAGASGHVHDRVELLALERGQTARAVAVDPDESHALRDGAGDPTGSASDVVARVRPRGGQRRDRGTRCRRGPRASCRLVHGAAGSGCAHAGRRHLIAETDGRHGLIVHDTQPLSCTLHVGGALSTRRPSHVSLRSSSPHAGVTQRSGSWVSRLQLGPSAISHGARVEGRSGRAQRAWRRGRGRRWCRSRRSCSKTSRHGSRPLARRLGVAALAVRATAQLARSGIASTTSADVVIGATRPSARYAVVSSPRPSPLRRG